MKEIAKKIKLLKPLDVDKITIKRDRYFPNAYIIDLPLDSMPDHVWQYIFERTWKSSRHLWDRKLFVISDKLRLVTTADEFGDKLDWVEQVIKETNKGIDKHNLAVEKEEEIRIKEEMKKQKLWDEKARVEIIKDALRKRYA
jgi:hypothetical protein